MIAIRRWVLEFDHPEAEEFHLGGPDLEEWLQLPDANPDEVVRALRQRVCRAAMSPAMGRRYQTPW